LARITFPFSEAFDVSTCVLADDPSSSGFGKRWLTQPMMGRPMSRSTTSLIEQDRRSASSVAAATAAGVLTLLFTVGLTLTLMGSAQAAAVSVPLGTARSYAVLAGSTVTNTGPSVINGDVGLSPGTSVSGFPPGTVNGTTHVADAVALQAKSDLKTAYDVAAAEQPPNPVTSDLGGQTLVGGVYNSATSLGLTGALTLDGKGNPDSVWVFQAGSTLTTASASEVNLINGASLCNVYWQVGSSATLGTASTFRGTILALQSITVTTNVTILGRVLARKGAVTLDTDTITRPKCTSTTPTSATASPTKAPTTSPTVGASTSSPTGGPTSGPESNGPGGPNGPQLPGGPTGPTPQIPQVPTGPPQTGDGGSIRGSHPILLLTGGGALLASLAAFCLWRRDNGAA
jgi:hypothetical protein